MEAGLEGQRGSGHFCIGRYVIERWHLSFHPASKQNSFFPSGASHQRNRQLVIGLVMPGKREFSIPRAHTRRPRYAQKSTMIESKRYLKLKAEYSQRELTYDELAYLRRQDDTPAVVPQEPELMPQKSVTKEGLAKYLQTMHWGAFFTSTFKQHQRYSATAIDRVVHTLREPRLRPTKMFVAAEQHMLGGWHCHGLLEFPESRHSSEIVSLNRLSLSGLGYNMISNVGNLDACSAYLSKYLVKDDWHGDWRMIGRAKFWRPGAGGTSFASSRPGAVC